MSARPCRPGSPAPGAVLGAALLALAAALDARALGPHEVLLLVNSRSAASLEVANHYRHRRGIPEENVVRLDLPDSVRGSPAAIGPEAFTRLVWEPANRAVSERGLGDRILAWAYSCDFPVRVDTSPPVSLTGLTFLRNELPEGGLIPTGRYASALFRGPAAPGGPSGPPVSFETMRAALGERMPLPAILLGHAGARGLEVPGILRTLEYGRLSDASRPAGEIHFVKTADIRSRCRDWQFDSAAEELRALGVRAVVSSNFPAGRASVAGVMTGLPRIDAAAVRSFAPGAFAEHLTSFAAVFDTADQTKATAWLRAGATASAGTVTEPLALWTKFPSARCFVHYASGATLLESLYLGIASPTQILPLGDPLARPWAPPLSMTLVLLDDEPLSGKGTFAGTLFPAEPPAGAQYVFFLDGRALPGPAGTPQVTLDAEGLSPGYHELRCAAYTRGTLRRQAFAARGFEVASPERGVRITAPAANDALDLLRPLEVRVETRGGPAGIGLFGGGHLVARAAGADTVSLRVDPAALGAGPVTLQALAVYDGGPSVRSAPVRVRFAPRNRPPEVVAARARTEGPDLVVEVEAKDADGDALSAGCWRGLETAGAQAPEGAVLVPRTGGVVQFTPNATNRYSVAPCGPAGGDALAVDLFLPGRPDADVGSGEAALVFGFEAPGTFGFAGLSADRSAWVLGAYRDGKRDGLVTHGVPARAGRWYRVSVRREDGALVARADGEEIARRPADGRPFPGTAGLLAGRRAARFRGLAACVGRGTPGTPIRLPGAAAQAGTLEVRVGDGWAETARAIGAGRP